MTFVAYLLYLVQFLTFYVVSYFMLNRKGDYFRYLAEFKTDQERKEAAEQSLKGYEACYTHIMNKFGYLYFVCTEYGFLFSLSD